MATRYLYTLKYIGEDGDWITEKHKFYPKVEMDTLEANGKIWKLAVTKNPEYKETP